MGKMKELHLEEQQRAYQRMEDLRMDQLIRTKKMQEKINQEEKQASTMDKTLTIMGYMCLALVLIGMIGFVIESPEPTFTPFARLAAGALSVGLCIVLLTILRNETKDLFK